LLPERADTLRRVAHVAALSWRRKCGAHVDARELENEGVLEVLITLERNPNAFCEERGRFDQWAYTIAWRAMKRYTLAASVPVTGDTYLQCWHREISRVDSAICERIPSELDPERVLSHEEAREMVRARVVELLGDGTAAFALGVFGALYTPAQISEQHHVPATQVYRLIQSVKGILRDDAELKELWENGE